MGIIYSYTVDDLTCTITVPNYTPRELTALASGRTDAPPAAVRTAAEIVADEKNLPNEAIARRRVIEVAGKIAESQTITPQPLELRFPPSSEVMRSIILEQITEDVEELREGLWGNRDPLFGPEEWDRVGVWIHKLRWPEEHRTQVSQEEHRRLVERERHEMRIREMADDVVIELSGILDKPMVIDFEVRHRVRIGERRTIEINSDHDPLATFARRVPRIAAYADVPEHHIARFVFCGVEPRIPRATIALRTVNKDRHHRRSQVVITLNTPGLSQGEVRRLFQAIQQQWSAATGSNGKETITEDDLVLREIVEQLGGLGRDRQPRGFWKGVSEVWRERTGNTATPNSLSTRWSRYRDTEALLPIRGPLSPGSGKKDE